MKSSFICRFCLLRLGRVDHRTSTSSVPLARSSSLPTAEAVHSRKWFANISQSRSQGPMTPLQQATATINTTSNQPKNETTSRPAAPVIELIPTTSKSKEASRRRGPSGRRPVQKHSSFDTPEELKAYQHWLKNVRQPLVSVGTSPKSNDKGRKSPKTARPLPERLRLMLELESVERMAKYWESFGVLSRQRFWPHLMRAALESCPESAGKILEATLHPLPPRYAVQDVLTFLAFWQKGHISAEDMAGRKEAILDLTMKILRLYRGREEARKFSLRQHTIGFMTSDIGLDKLKDFMACLAEIEHPLHSNTILKLAHRFAKDPERKDTAMQISQAALSSGKAEINSTQWSSLVTLLLHDPRKPDEPGDTSAIAATFDALLQCGMVPNLLSATALIRTLCVKGNTRTAWEIFDTLYNSGMEPDAVLLATLLFSARDSPDCYEEMERVISLAIKHDAVNGPFLNCLLSTFLSLAEAQSYKNGTPHRVVPAFGPMMWLYAKVFYRGPLQQLIPIDLEGFDHATPTLPPGLEEPARVLPLLHRIADLVKEPLPPTSRTLGLMFRAYAGSLSSSSSALSLYSNIRRLIREDNTTYNRFVSERDTQLHDITIRRICEFPGMQRAALDIIEDMLKGQPGHQTSAGSSISPACSSEGPGDGNARTGHPKPSVHTWTILLHGFLRQGQVANCEHIVKMMKQHGVTPNLVTWNTLLSGYSYSHDVDRSIQTIKRLQESGHQADDRTMKALTRVASQEGVMDEIEAALNPEEESFLGQDWDDATIEAAIEAMEASSRS